MKATTLPMSSFQAILNKGGWKRDRNQRFTLATWHGGIAPVRIDAFQENQASFFNEHYLALLYEIVSSVQSPRKAAPAFVAVEFPDPSTL